MSAAVLVINAGSSSIKFAIYEAGTLGSLVSGKIEAIGAGARLDVSGGKAGALAAASPPPHGDHEEITGWLLDRLDAIPDLPIAGAGHRVVHGGLRFDRPAIVSDEVMAELEALIPLARLHQPHNIAAIRAVARRWPRLPQVACFDTAFHRTQPRLAQLFPIPTAYADEGVLRYGFHGLSYEHIVSVLPGIAGAKAEGRVIVAHLGNGASLCAMRGRQSVATTMGLTALDGLMMGTRSGGVDPGLVLYLLRERGLSAAAVEDLLANCSGLLGVSGISADVRVLEASSEAAAREALDLFAYRCVSEMGSLAAALGGLDALVFTAGIGENSAHVRQKICEGMSFVGLRLDPARNRFAAPQISADDSPVAVFVVPANEELVIARATQDLLGLGA